MQVADSNGQVTFTTIFPGVLRPAIRTSTEHVDGTSQICSGRVMFAARSTGARRVTARASTISPRVTIASDNVFGDNSAAQMAAMTPSVSGSITAGYTGTLTIGVPA